MTTITHGGGQRRSLWKGPAIITAFMLLIPLLGNSFVEGWNWRPGGFVVLGVLVFSAGLVYQLITRNVSAASYRRGVGIAIVTSLVLAWGNFVQAADDINPAAVMYLAVPVVALISAAFARFRAGGMAIALFVTAFAQAVVLTIVLIVRDPHATAWTAPVVRGFSGNALFLLLFAASALLFRKAAREMPAPVAV